MHQTLGCGRRQLHALVRLRTDGAAEVPQFASGLEGHAPALAPHRRDAAVGGPMLRAHQWLQILTPRSVRTWV